MTQRGGSYFASVSAVQHTHDIEFVDGVVRKTYVSWSKGEPDREWAALEHLEQHAPGLGPRPIERSVADGRPVVVMSRVPGEPLDGTLSLLQMAALTSALQVLFTVPVPAVLPERANDPSSFPHLFGSWLAREYEWTRCQDSVLVRHAVAVARAWTDDHEIASDWIVDRVIALGDGNLDNVLWDGDVCRLIDWEEYGASDFAYELADVVEHASSRLQRRLDVEEFLRAFGLDPAQRARVEHHRKMFACFWLAMLLPGNRGWHRNPRGATEDQARHVLRLIGD